jgi:hypothetical protein
MEENKVAVIFITILFIEPGQENPKQSVYEKFDESGRR